LTVGHADDLHVDDVGMAVQELLDLPGYTFSPPRMIMSLMRPTMFR